jgi:hypothetical protein
MQMVRIGDALKGLGLICRPQLDEALVQQARDRNTYQAVSAAIAFMKLPTMEAALRSPFHNRTRGRMTWAIRSMARTHRIARMNMRHDAGGIFDWK